MVGTIIGDIVGSRFEFAGTKSKDFELFTDKCRFTDDSVMSIAIGNALLESRNDISKLKDRTIYWMKKLGRKYPDAGYGFMFSSWLQGDDESPYNSYGNGGAMRVGGCGFAANTRKEALEMSDIVTGVTHDHPESIKAARAVTECIFMARCGIHKDDIKAFINKEYYDMSFKLDDIRDDYEFDVTSQGSVPEALQCFFEADTFEETIRNAVSLGGDSDTQAAIAGSIAEAYYGVARSLWLKAGDYLGEELFRMMNSFQFTFCGLRNIDSEDLEDGKMLCELKEDYINDPSNENLGPFLSCLRDSEVLVPFDRQSGEVALNSNLDKHYFPVFSNKSQIPELYMDRFDIRKMPMMKAIEKAFQMKNDVKDKDSVYAMSLDGFTNPVDISFEWMMIIKDLCSRLKLRWER